jgi:hypothetical protein
VALVAKVRSSSFLTHWNVLSVVVLLVGRNLGRVLLVLMSLVFLIVLVSV